MVNRFRFVLASILVAACTAAFSSFPELIINTARSIGYAFRQAVAFALECLAPANRPAFASEGYVDLAPSGIPLDRALMQSLRHEAGVPRYSAARSI